MKAIFPTLMLSLSFFLSCNQATKLFGTESDNEDPNLIKTYYDNGALKAEIRVDSSNNRHGWSKSYFPNGNLKTEILYRNGAKDSAIQYYENGNKFLVFDYENNLKNGLRTKYWENGQVQSLLKYKNNYPGKPLQEFSKKGKKITKYPKLTIRQIDNLNSTGEYIVEVFFDKQPARGTYYFGSLEDGFLSNANVEIEKINGKARIVYRPIPGTFKMERINFVGKYRTYYGNPYLTEKSINLAIDF